MKILTRRSIHVVSPPSKEGVGVRCLEIHWTLCHKGNPIINWSKLSPLNLSNLSDAVKVKSCLVWRSVSIGHWSILNMIDKMDIDGISFTHNNHGTRQNTIVCQDTSVASICSASFIQG